MGGLLPILRNRFFRGDFFETAADEAGSALVSFAAIFPFHAERGGMGNEALIAWQRRDGLCDFICLTGLSALQ